MTIPKSASLEYKSWCRAKTRCNDKNWTRYDRYGGRGIKMCAKWANSFAAFYQDMGPRLPGMTLERINNDGDYEPGNCRWATITEQANNRHTNRRIEFNGQTKTLSQWCREYRMPIGAVFLRMRRGWTFDRAISTSLPPKKIIKYRSKELEATKWAKITGLPYRVIWSRIKAGWTAKETLETPYTGKFKLAAAQVAEIRKRAESGEPQSELSKAFGVCQSNISRIVNKNRHKTL